MPREPFVHRVRAFVNAQQAALVGPLRFLELGDPSDLGGLGVDTQMTWHGAYVVTPEGQNKSDEVAVVDVADPAHPVAWAAMRRPAVATTRCAAAAARAVRWRTGIPRRIRTS